MCHQELMVSSIHTFKMKFSTLNNQPILLCKWDKWDSSGQVSYGQLYENEKNSCVIIITFVNSIARQYRCMVKSCPNFYSFEKK